jgi:hypothetical protein
MKHARRAGLLLALLAFAMCAGSVAACALIAGLEDKEGIDPTATAVDSAAGEASFGEASPSALDGGVGDAMVSTGEVVAMGQSRPWGIAVDDAFVYWTNEGDNTVMRMPMNGGAPVAIAKNQFEPRHILVDAQNVIWSNSNTSNRAGDLDGGAYFEIAHLTKAAIGTDGGSGPNRIETAKGPSKLRDMAIDVAADDQLWTSWLDRVTRYHRDDQLQQHDVANKLTAAEPTAVAVAGSWVYWYEQQSYELWTAPKNSDLDGGDAGGEPLSGVAFATLPGASEVTDMIADGTALYMVTAAGAVLKVSTLDAPEGGAPTELAMGHAFPKGIAADDQYVYFTRTTADDGPAAGLVVMVAKSGANSMVVAQGLDQPRGIAVSVAADGSHTVYWADYGDGTIRRARVR